MVAAVAYTVSTANSAATINSPAPSTTAGGTRYFNQNAQSGTVLVRPGKSGDRIIFPQTSVAVSRQASDGERCLRQTTPNPRISTAMKPAAHAVNVQMMTPIRIGSSAAPIAPRGT